MAFTPRGNVWPRDYGVCMSGLATVGRGAAAEPELPCGFVCGCVAARGTVADGVGRLDGTVAVGTTKTDECALVTSTGACSVAAVGAGALATG